MGTAHLHGRGWYYLEKYPKKCADRNCSFARLRLALLEKYPRKCADRNRSFAELRLVLLSVIESLSVSLRRNGVRCHSSEQPPLPSCVEDADSSCIRGLSVELPA